MLFTDFLAHFNVISRDSGGLLATCPNPEHAGGKADRPENPHLLLSVSDAGKALVKCRVGCSTELVVAAVGLTLRDLATVDTTDAPLNVRTASAKSPVDTAAIAGLAVELDAFAAALTAAASTAERARTYTTERWGLDAHAIARLGLGYDANTHRVIIPFRDPQGVPRGYQGRALNPDAQVRLLSPKNPEGQSWEKAGFFTGDTGWSEIVITEGPGDALTAAGIGFDSIGIAGAGNGDNTALIDNIARWAGTRPVVLCGDNDAAGAGFLVKLAEGLLARDVVVREVHVPEAVGKDLTDWRAARPDTYAREVIRAVADAKPLTAMDVASLVWDEKRYSLTDLGGARYLKAHIEAKGSGVHFTPETGFLLYEDGIWERDNIQKVRALAHEVADILRETAATMLADTRHLKDDDPAHDKARRFSRFASHAQSGSGINAMVRELQALPGVGASFTDFDELDWLIAFTNGYVDVRSGEFKPLTPDHKVTRRMAVAYNPNAKAPRFRSFLAECGLSPEVVTFLQTASGYGFTGYTSEHAMLVHWGPSARNGKSTLLEALRWVGGTYAGVTRFATFEQKGSGGIPNDVAALAKVRWLVANEGNAGRYMDEALLKGITGGDEQVARFLNREFFSFTPRFLLNMASNYRPEFRGQDGGLWERVNLVIWPRSFKEGERDKQLKLTLRDEAEGIAAWLVAGAKRWWKDQSLNAPAEVKQATEEYKATADPLVGFFPDGVLVADATPNPATSAPPRMTGKEVMLAYNTWAMNAGLQLAEKWGSRRLYAELSGRGLVKGKSNGDVYFVGIRPRIDADNLAATNAEKTAHEAEEVQKLHMQFDEVVSDISLTTDFAAGPSLDDLP